MTQPTNPALDLDTLHRAVARDAVAIRAILRLEPAGGPGDKVFPPTYVKEGKSETKYAMERRIVDGKAVDTVLLDSVASQANRIEEALLEGWRRKELSFPVVQVDFDGEEGLADLEQITTLQAPHRIADALLRDSIDPDGTPFRMTSIGQEFTDSRTNHATGMYKHCPTALVFGVWDSTGPKGGLGAKFQRCLVSEIVGYYAVAGVKVASRIDPAGIQKQAGPVYASRLSPGDWTTDPKEAVLEKGKPQEFSRKGAGDKGSPATINHGNIPPGIDHASGGVTISHAVHTVVLSLAGLRRLRFQTTVDGTRLPADRRDEAEIAARTALAALALAGVTYQAEQGYDLRSRSLLVPTHPLVLEIVSRHGGDPGCYQLDREAAAALLAQASSAAEKQGFGWSTEPVTLRPAPKLAHLIRRSRDLIAAGESEEDA
jgi:CRISPR-associated protein Csb1